MINKIALTLCLLASAMMLTACGGTNVHTTGAMTQDLQVGLSPNLADEIQALFSQIFGRSATASEQQFYQQLLQSGTSLAQIRSMLVSSTENLTNIQNLVTSILGSPNATIVQSLLTAMQNGTAFSQLAALINSL